MFHLMYPRILLARNPIHHLFDLFFIGSSLDYGVIVCYIIRQHMRNESIGSKFPTGECRKMRSNMLHAFRNDDHCSWTLEKHLKDNEDFEMEMANLFPMRHYVRVERHRITLIVLVVFGTMQSITELGFLQVSLVTRIIQIFRMAYCVVQMAYGVGNLVMILFEQLIYVLVHGVISHHTLLRK